MLRFLHSHIFTEADLWVLLRIDFLKSILVLVSCLADMVVQARLNSPLVTPKHRAHHFVGKGGCCDCIHHAPLAGPSPSFRYRS